MTESSDKEVATSQNTFENKYKIVRQLGKGKTSTVYLVNHLFLDKELAIKLFKDKYWENQKRFTRAQREARTCASIDHPNVVKVYDFGVTEDGAPYIVQEFISGTNLRSLIKSEGSLDTERAVDIFKQIARGLNCLHENQVLHRDIKSENIVITKSESGRETVKLIDLGIARQEDDMGAIQSLTQSGQHVGSPYYISPEVCHGDSVDNRSDIYSFGCVMYEVIAGHTPFRSESVLKTLEMHLKEKPTSLSEYGIPHELNELILKCLEKAADLRFSSCIEILETLDHIYPNKATPAVKREVSAKGTPLLTQALIVLPAVAICFFLLGQYSSDSKKPTATVNKKKTASKSRKRAAKWEANDDLFALTIRANMLSQFTIPRKSSMVFDQALKEASAQGVSPRKKCLIAQQQCNNLRYFKNWEKIDQVRASIKNDLALVEKKALKDKTYASKLSTIPLLYYYYSSADLERNQVDKALTSIDKALELSKNLPDSRVLLPYLQIQKARCIAKLGNLSEAIDLVHKSEKELDKVVGASHPIAIQAHIQESKIYEDANDLSKALKSQEEALSRAKASPVGLNMSFIEERKSELTAKLNKAK